MAEPPKKRARSKNFSFREVEVLKSKVIANFQVLNAKHCNGSSGVTKRRQDEVWESICKEVNSVGVSTRTVIDVKEKWRNMTKQAKAEVSKQRASAHRTGGGPPDPLVDPLMDEIAAVYANSASFHGIPGAMESETEIVSDASQIPIDLGLSSVIDLGKTFSPMNGQNFPLHIFSDADLGDSLLGGVVPFFKEDHGEKTTENPVMKPMEIRKSSDEAQTANGSKPVMKQSDTCLQTASETRPKRTQRSLKEVQLDFYAAALQNEKERYKLIKEQMETVHKASLFLDIFLEKFTKNQEE